MVLWISVKLINVLLSFSYPLKIYFYNLKAQINIRHDITNVLIFRN